MNGKFITIEGIEGSGKSSLISGLHQSLTSSGKTVFLTKEPGGSPLGKTIREILLSSPGTKISTTTEVLLFAADRAEHVKSVLIPSLSNFDFVICDRFLMSTLAYQGFGRGERLEILNSINNYATSGLKPDLTLLLDLSVKTGLSRAKARAGVDSSSWNRFEAEELEFHEKIRQGFLKLSKESKKIDKKLQIEIINAEDSQETVLKNSLNAIKNCFSEEFS